MGHSTPWEAFAEQPHLVAALLFLLALQWFIANRFVVKEVELHLYQHQFLKKLGGAEGASAGLQIIISRAMTEPQTFAAIFDAVHCRHCASATPAGWISAAKGTKKRYPVELSTAAQSFLKRKLIGEFGGLV